jgi:hypothetical protein
MGLISNNYNILPPIRIHQNDRSYSNERQGGKKAKLFNIAITGFHIFLFDREGVGGVPGGAGMPKK